MTRHHCIIPGLGLLLASLAVVVPSHEALGQVIDQQNTFVAGGARQSIRNGIAEGQSFRPALDRVDFVQFGVAEMTLLGDHEPPVTLAVNLHHGARTTPVIAQSSTAGVDGAGVHFPMFYFDPPVTLVPGDTYTFIVVYTAGTGNWGLTVSNNTYAHGQLIGSFGSPNFYDAWFREGLLAPVPATSATWGRIKNAYR